MLLANSRAPWGSLSTFDPFTSTPASFGCARSIPVRPGDRRVRWVHSRAPRRSSGSLVCVLSFSERLGGRRVRSCAFGAFPWFLVSSGSFVCFRSITVRPGCRRLVSGAIPASPGCSFSYARFIHSRPMGSRVPSSAFGPFPCALEVVVLVRGRSVHSRCSMGILGVVRVLSVHSRTPLRSSG